MTPLPALGQMDHEGTFLPGITQQHPNDSITTLKNNQWASVVPLLGKDAELILSSLLLDCGLFIHVAAGKDNYFQLSGAPLANLVPHTPMASEDNPLSRPASIRFIRNRILYARPSITQAGQVKFGLKHEHVLERFSALNRSEHATHILKYVFPRQFGLHNIFTSKVDPMETAQPLKDYTFREAEILAAPRKAAKVPRRLRGGPFCLVQKIQRNHKACSYSQLLRHYCPVSSSSSPPTISEIQPESSPARSRSLISQILPSSRTSNLVSQSLPPETDAETSFLPHSTRAECVSAFCRSVLRRLLPATCFGTGLDGTHNFNTIMYHVDRFVHMRRFETMSLHEVIQHLRIRPLGWLQPRPESGQSNLCKSEHIKRVELLQEFVYFVFDSILIPIIRSNFYVTESSTHRNRLFYFRHDVWRKLSEPTLASLRLTMYVALKPSQVRETLRGQTFGYSHLRLLPKDVGARPITNLRRRQVKQVSGRRVLGASINTQLGPLFSVLKYERSQHIRDFGSALFSVGDIHEKLAGFKNGLASASPVYFAKVDIKSCFDSIPQQRLLEVVATLLEQTDYRTTKHAEFKARPGEAAGSLGQPQRRFIGSARPADDEAVFTEMAAAALASKKREVVFAETGNQRLWSRNYLFKQLKRHVQETMVKVGKKHMIQKDGIPQGSILSSLLCNHFYGTFESQELGFLRAESCLLLRLIDDFLLLTTDQNLARKFLDVMGNESNRYGIQVNAEKSLANFEVTIKGCKVPRIHGTGWFPYCGMGIDMKTLEMSKDRHRRDAYVSNTLTVDKCSKAGIVLRRKVLTSLKIQMHGMLLDISLNSKEQVLSTLMSNFWETAMKFHQYMVQLGSRRKPSTGFIKQLIEDLISAAVRSSSAKSNSKGHIGRSEMCWIGSYAFERVLLRKQCHYVEVLEWLSSLRKEAESRLLIPKTTREAMMRRTEKDFAGYIY